MTRRPPVRALATAALATAALATAALAAGCAPRPPIARPLARVEPPPPAAAAPPASLAPPSEPFRVAPPAAGPTPELHLPAVQTARMANGLRVWLVEHHELPIVQLTLVLPAGADRQAGPAQAGLASLVAAMLDEGTRRRGALEIAEQIAFLGASLSADATYDGAFVSLNTLTRHLDAALELAADVVRDPAFPPKELERVRNDRITALLQQRDVPRAVARKVLGRALFGDAHPYGHLLLGEEATLKALRREELIAFWRRTFRPDEAILVVVGDVTQGDVMPRLTRALGGWRAVGPARPTPPPTAPPRAATRIVLVDKPGAPQSEVRVAQLGLPRASPDYFTAEVLNTILGGMSSSRLFVNLRQQHGYTYGAYSAFDYRRGPGPFLAGGAMRTDVTDASVRELLAELRRLREEPVAGDELARAKAALVRSLPGRFESASDIAAAVADLALYRLPLDYYDGYVRAIEAVSAEQVQRLARAQLDLEHLAIVVVGDRAAIEPGLAALAVGPVERRDPDGKPLP